MSRESTHERGMAVRRRVLGDAYVDAAVAGTTSFTERFQDFITRYGWGEIWADETLDLKTRSCMTQIALIALGRLDEYEMHVRAAVGLGLTPREIEAVLMQSALYCGVPAANAAFPFAQRALAEAGAAEDMPTA